MPVFEPKVSTRGSGYFFAEIFTAFGPAAIGATGDNSFPTLYGREWLLVFDREDGYLHLFQEDDEAEGEWVEVLAGLPPTLFGSPLPEDARRVSFAFDQSARLIVAYESGGVVKVTRWDTVASAYIQNVSFAGLDPCLLMDATLNYWIPGSDVVLFYLSADGTEVRYRIQDENYGTEHTLYTFDSPVVFDRAVASALRYQLLLSDVAGEPLDDALVSALYTYHGRAEMIGGGNIIGKAGVYTLVVFAFAETEGLVGAASPPGSGEYLEPVIELDVGPDDLVGAASLPVTFAGSYDSVVIELDVGPDDLVGSAAPPATFAGVYTLVVIEHAQAPDEIVGSAGPGPAFGGSYDLA